MPNTLTEPEAGFSNPTGIEETFSFYRLPWQHYKHLKSTNMLERLSEEIKRCTHVVRIFPNRASCLRLIRVLVNSVSYFCGRIDSRFCN